jgi:hypothetical protein
MGCNGISSDWRDNDFCSQETKTTIKGNPDPENWELLDILSYKDDYSILKLRYLDCTNYEGVKILIVKNRIFGKVIDPHFCKNDLVVARFIPDENGWQYAKSFMENVLNKEINELETEVCRIKLLYSSNKISSEKMDAMISEIYNPKTDPKPFIENFLKD